MFRSVDYSVPDFWELGMYGFFGAMIGAFLAALLFLAVVYMPI
jgi:hypothetical protein